MEQAIPKEKTQDGFWIEMTQEDGKTIREHFRGVRCGLAWPTAISPGFYCLVGQLSKSLPNGRYPLCLLKEGNEHILNVLFQNLFDDLGQFNAFEIFSDLSFKFQNYLLDFNQHYMSRKLQDVKLASAPFYQSFPHGVYVVRSWIKDEALHLPTDTIIREQLKMIKEEDLREGVEGQFYAINALRYVVSAYETSLVYPSSPARRSVSSKALPPGAWT
jgi:hypothetical protein